MPIRIQCMLLLKSDVKLDKGRRRAPIGYAFLSGEFLDHPACDLLSRNNIKIVVKDQARPPRKASLDVFEVLLDKCNRAPASGCVRFYVESSHVGHIKRMITVSNDKFDFRTKHRRKEIRPALDKGNLKVMERFLAADIEYNYYIGSPGSGTERSLLHFAAMFGYESLVRLLVKKGADLEEQGNVLGVTPLHLAVYYNHPNIVNLLLKEGANVNSKQNLCGSSPLHGALRFPHMMELLISNGADLEVKRDEGYTPLHLATWLCNLTAVSYLLERGADVNSLVGPSTSATSPLRGATPLIIAVKDKWMPGIATLLKAGADVNARCSKGLSVLHYAVKSAHLQVVTTILNHRPKTNLAENRWAFRAALCDHGEEMPNILEKLIKSGFNVKRGDVIDLSYLHCAIFKNQLPIVKKLVNFGADVNQVASFHGLKITPLHQAARHGHADIVEFLLDSGADVHAKRILDGCQKTPLSDAVGCSNVGAAKLLLAKNAVIEPDLLDVAIRKNSSSIVQLLLENGAALHPPRPGPASQSKNPIYTALELGHSQVFELLMHFGAGLDRQTLLGFSCPNLDAALDHCFSSLSSSFVTSVKSLNAAGDLDWNDPDVKVWLEYIIKVEAAFGSSDAQGMIPGDLLNALKLDPFKRKCDSEVALMRSETIGCTNISFHDVVIKGVQGCACFSRNKSFERTMRAYDPTVSYPIYARVISCHFRLGNLRRQLLASALKFFRSFRSHFTALPHDLKEMVLSYLSNQDLIILQNQSSPG